MKYDYFKTDEVRPPYPYRPNTKEFKEIVLEAKQNIKFFARAILGQATPDFYKEWIELVSENKKVCILASRGLGKSWFYSYIYPLYIIFTTQYSLKEKEMVLIGDTFTEASNRSRLIMDTIENNPWFRGYVGNKNHWARNDFKTRNGVRVRVFGIESAKRGPHPDWIIMDDILTKKTTISLDKVRQKYEEVITNYDEPRTQTIVVGTPFSFDDIYTDFKEKGVVKVYEFPVLDREGNSIWVERRPISFLEERRKEMGEDTFAKEILLKPVSGKTAVFKSHHIDKAMKQSYKLANYNFKPEDVTVMGVDFAFSDASGADYTVITVVSRWLNKYRVVDVWRKQGTSIGEIVDVLTDLLKKYPCVRTIIAEDTGQQIAVVKELKERLPVYIYPFTTKTYTRNKILSILALLFENGNITVPANNFYPDTKAYSTQLRSELGGFINKGGNYESRAKHDDCVFSLAFATWYLYEKCNVFGESDSYKGDTPVSVASSVGFDMRRDSALNRHYREDDEYYDEYDDEHKVGGFGW